MEWNLLLFCLIGGVVSVDTDTFLQSMFSQPLVACAFVGLLFDNFTIGLTVGMLMQLPFLAEIPVGARNLSFGNLGAFVSAGLAIFFTEKGSGSENVILITAILWGTVISYVTSPFLKYRRNLNLLFVKKADKFAQKGELGQISLLHYFGVLTAFFFGIFYCWFFFVLGENSISFLMKYIPGFFEVKLNLVKPVLWGAGVGAMFYCFVNKKSLSMAGIGVITGAIFLLVKTYF